MDLFYSIRPKAPLAARMRPVSLDEFVGQEELVGKGKILRRLVEAKEVALPSMILYGPPGTGKTTLAGILAKESEAHFEELNATSAGVGDIRKVLDTARKWLTMEGRRTILFLDEVHRLSKSQQEVLLPALESGIVIVIGSTTESPSHEINPAMLSRMRVFRLKALEIKEIKKLLQRALADKDRGLGESGVSATDEVLEIIADVANGDARHGLSLLEQAAGILATEEHKIITQELLQTVIGERVVSYDKSGNAHYDHASCLQKSMRGSDPQATLHYLAKMIAGGEDEKFIARRIVVCAAEDVGLADPMALVVANSAAQAVQFVGFPEAQLILAEAALYVALAPKSNSASKGIMAALQDVRSRNCGEIPLHLRDAHYKGAAKLGFGVHYKYPHDYPHGYVEQQYLPDALVGSVYYEPVERGHETRMKERQSLLKGESKNHA